ncbi:hypothetical protein GCM10010968_20130 [Agrococcus terreus]|uniref:Uncharacterized protein n=1 Tax=Agrococcus terreus TaxID=574649 RepID=A0ABQ2KKT7_9MICO|nr:hypothetical protein GCM10010968_20130 [Agrococcus terreus]
MVDLRRRPLLGRWRPLLLGRLPRLGGGRRLTGPRRGGMGMLRRLLLLRERGVRGELAHAIDARRRA